MGYWIKLIIILLFVSVVLGCGSKKKIIEKTELKQKTELKKIDSVVKITKTLPIKDTVIIALATDDKKTDSIITKKLKTFYTKKTSGKNSYSIKYDTIKKALEITANVQGNEDKNTTVKTEKTEKETEIKTTQKTETKTKGGFNFYGWLFFLILLAVVIIYIKLKN